MFREKRYIFNEKTLSYEIDRRTSRQILVRAAAVLLAGLVCFAVYFYLYADVLGYMTPKEYLLVRENRMLLAKIESLNERMAEDDVALTDIQRRDNVVYRPIFGMDEISEEVRNSGFGAMERYSRLESLEHSDFLISSAMRMDILTKKTYIQSKSFDDVSLLAKRAGDMASCVPSICPTRISGFRITSSFGYRVHPISHKVAFHGGMDIAGHKGDPVYATGDGIVMEVRNNFFGYGNMVVIDHGFGYKTRYAHLSEALVHKGDRVSRGELIATLGNSGRSTGPHLHYEVLYRDKQINPWNFLSNSMSPEEFAQITKMARR